MAQKTTLCVLNENIILQIITYMSILFRLFGSFKCRCPFVSTVFVAAAYFFCTILFKWTQLPQNQVTIFINLHRVEKCGIDQYFNRCESERDKQPLRSQAAITNCTFNLFERNTLRHTATPYVTFTVVMAVEKPSRTCARLLIFPHLLSPPRDNF